MAVQQGGARRTHRLRGSRAALLSFPGQPRLPPQGHRFNNGPITPGYCLHLRGASRRISSISDLAARVREGENLKLASTLEFLNRTDGLKPLQRTYGFEFTLGNVVGMDTGAIYNAFRRGFDVRVVFATDG